MRLPLFPAARLGTLSLGFAKLAAFFKDLFHEIVAGKDSARAAPVLGMSGPSVIGEQGTDLPLQGCHSFFKRRLGHG
jgi:hypothetical protein